MNRMMMLARIRLQGREMSAVMNQVFLLLDGHGFRLKNFIEHEAYTILKQWKNEVNDAFSQGMTAKEFAAYLIFDAIKVELASGDHHVYRGVLSVNGKTLVEDSARIIRILQAMDLVHPDKVVTLTTEIAGLIKSAG